MHLVVDTYSLFYKYKKSEKSTIIINGDKIYNNAINYLSNSLNYFCTKHLVSGVTLCMETEGILKKTYKIDSNYKKYRKKDNHKMDYSFLWIKKLFSNYDNYEILSAKGFEGDDLGYYKKKELEGKDHCLLFSDDSDWLQLISKDCSIIFNGVLINYDNCIEILGFNPKTVVDDKALFGDKADGIKRAVSKKYSFLEKNNLILAKNKEDHLTAKEYKKYLVNLSLVTIGSIIPTNVDRVVGKSNIKKLSEVTSSLKMNSQGIFQI